MKRTRFSPFTLVELPVVSRAKARAFTLVELLMVCAIIIVLVGIGIGVYNVASRKSAESKTEAMIKKMCIALEAYKNKTGYYIQQSTVGAFYVDNYVSNDTDINDFLDVPSAELGGKRNDPGGDSDRGAFTDPFGREFRYQCPGTNNRGSFDLYSQGADTATTADDLKNW